MAIAIPLIMGAMGASTMVTALTSIAFAVTGISSKINEAASGVFGSDLVQVANMFGTVAGAGGFGPIDAAATAGDYTNAMDMASDAVTNADPQGYLAQMQNAGDTANASMGGDAASLASQSDGVAQMGGDQGDFNLASMSAKPTDGMAAPTDATVTPVSPVTPANQMLVDARNGMGSDLLATGAAGQQAAGASAASAQAAGQQATAAQAVQPAVAPNATAGIQAPPTPGQEPGWLQKLGMTDAKGNVTPGGLRMAGNLIGGVGKGYEAAQAARMKQAQFDKQQSMMNQTTGVRATR